ncbi:MAG: AAA family ATPase [Actinobacteria bacterium]|nr:AAA family ATPase [Actinomycetota bacterium]
MTLCLTRLEIRGDEFKDVTRYPFNIPSLQRRYVLRFSSPVTFLVGENGSGKSTLIQALAQRCGLDLWAQPKQRLRAGELPPTALAAYLDVALQNGLVQGGLFSAEVFRTWAEFLDEVTEIDPGQAKYHGCSRLTYRSHGEGILTYLQARYRTPGLYFLDEPESALSPASQVELLRVLDEFRRSGHAQFVVATHSPILMALPEGHIFHLSDSGICETKYMSTQHYQLYRDFLDDPESFIS